MSFSSATSFVRKDGWDAMNLFSLAGWDTIEEAVVNGVFVTLMFMIAYLLWEIYAGDKQRRRARRDRELGRWQDQ